ncbi:MAG TPA: hypothetical protein VGX91_08385 [Candidatus Cybelea sp.]|jgi:hypothetical protein|nr:hypothetical protein [Candidatus Cybelea sp.]
MRAHLAAGRRRASYQNNAKVPPVRSPISIEIAWLGFFLVIFVAAVYLFVRTLVPHHFNDKIAIVLAGLFSGLVMIGVRAWVTSRGRSR